MYWALYLGSMLAHHLQRCVNIKTLLVQILWQLSGRWPRIVSVSPSISRFVLSSRQADAASELYCDVTLRTPLINIHIFPVYAHKLSRPENTRRWTNVGPASQTLIQHWTDMGSTYRVQWVDPQRWFRAGISSEIMAKHSVNVSIPTHYIIGRW